MFYHVLVQLDHGWCLRRRDWLINVAKRFGLKDSHRSSTNVRPRFIVDGGLLILSRLPIAAELEMFEERSTVYICLPVEEDVLKD